MDRNEMFNSMIPELKEWNNGEGITIENRIACVGSFEMAIGFGELFWPDFIEYNDGIFFADFDEKCYHSFLDRTGGDMISVQKVMNHRHLVDLHCMDQKVDSEMLSYLGEKIHAMWTAKLNMDFPVSV